MARTLPEHGKRAGGSSTRKGDSRTMIGLRVQLVLPSQGSARLGNLAAHGPALTHSLSTANQRTDTRGRHGAIRGSPERRRWADAPMNERLLSRSDGALTATLLGCAGVARGLHNETSDHTIHQRQCCCVSLWHRGNNQSADVTGGRGSLRRTSASAWLQSREQDHAFTKA